MSKQNKQSWRPASYADLARVVAGEKVKARFRDYDTQPWQESNLIGGTSSDYAWVDSAMLAWKQCQISTDPPKKQSAAPTIKICDPLEIGAQYAQADRDFRKFVDKAQAGELSFTCSFVWEGPESIKVKVGDRIQHPNGCCIDITETGFKVNATLDTVEFGK
jgi:hypothetical protein